MSLFNYNTISIQFDRKNALATISLNKQCEHPYLTHEMIFELESVINYITPHLEIQTILLTSEHEYFSFGLNPENNKLMKAEDLENMMNRMRKLIIGLYHLPQTIIVDLKKGAKGIASELSLAADFRLIHENGYIQFDHLSKGRTPCIGGTHILSYLVGQSRAKSWIMTSREVSSKECIDSGLIEFFYDRFNKDQKVINIISAINSVAPVQRIQTKKLFLDSIYHYLNHGFENEWKTFKSSNLSGDWKEYSNAKKEFRKPVYKSAKQFAEIIQFNRNEK